MNSTNTKKYRLLCLNNIHVQLFCIIRSKHIKYISLLYSHKVIVYLYRCRSNKPNALNYQMLNQSCSELPKTLRSYCKEIGIPFQNVTFLLLLHLYTHVYGLL